MQSNKTYEVLDHNIDTILAHYTNNSSYKCIIYVKNDVVIYSVYDNSTLIDTQVVDYFGSHIVKVSGNFALDSNGAVYKFIMEKILNNVADFNFAENSLYILSKDNKMYRVNVCVDTDGYFKKKLVNIKSSNNVKKK